MDIMRNQKFIIQPHFRLQEWVAEEKGYFKDEGLDYEFREEVQATGGKIHDKGAKVGAYQSFEEGRKSDVSCACHWTVNVAATSGHGKLYADLYSVAPSGIFVPADSPVTAPEQLAGVPISNAEICAGTIARHGFKLTDETVRPLVAQHRYLPPPTTTTSATLAKRMNDEIVFTFRRT